MLHFFFLSHHIVALSQIALPKDIRKRRDYIAYLQMPRTYAKSDELRFHSSECSDSLQEHVQWCSWPVDATRCSKIELDGSELLGENEPQEYKSSAVV